MTCGVEGTIGGRYQPCKTRAACSAALEAHDHVVSGFCVPMCALVQLMILMTEGLGHPQKGSICIYTLPRQRVRLLTALSYIEGGGGKRGLFKPPGPGCGSPSSTAVSGRARQARGSASQPPTRTHQAPASHTARDQYYTRLAKCVVGLRNIEKVLTTLQIVATRGSPTRSVYTGPLRHRLERAARSDTQRVRFEDPAPYFNLRHQWPLAP